MIKSPAPAGVIRTTLDQKTRERRSGNGAPNITPNITRSRIREMLRNRSLDRVAADLKMDPEEIEQIAALTGGVMLRCNDTGSQWRATGWRGAYRQVCMRGLTDWDWWQVGGDPA